jgi:hypothetical protein
MMWRGAIAPDEPHPHVPTWTGVVTKVVSVTFYASEFVLLASRQRNKITNWLKKLLPRLIASMKYLVKYRNCHAGSAKLFDVLM